MVFAGIGGGDDDAHGFLVEAFEAAVALQVFEMAANGAFFDKLIGLIAGNEFVGKEPLNALVSYRPTFAFGEGLPEECEV